MNYETVELRSKSLPVRIAYSQGYRYRVHIDLMPRKTRLEDAAQQKAQRAALRTQVLNGGFPLGQLAVIGAGSYYAPYMPLWDSDVQTYKDQLRAKFSNEMKQILGAKKQEWKSKSFNPRDKRMYVYTKDLEWLILAKLHSCNELVERIIRVEKLMEEK